MNVALSGPHGHHGHHGGGYGPYWGGWGPAYELGPLYMGAVPAASCAWYQDLKTAADGSTFCQTPATWLMVAGALGALLLMQRKN